MLGRITLGFVRKLVGAMLVMLALALATGLI